MQDMIQEQKDKELADQKQKLAFTVLTNVAEGVIEYGGSRQLRALPARVPPSMPTPSPSADSPAPPPADIPTSPPVEISPQGQSAMPSPAAPQQLSSSPVQSRQRVRRSSAPRFSESQSMAAPMASMSMLSSYDSPSPPPPPLSYGAPPQLPVPVPIVYLPNPRVPELEKQVEAEKAKLEEMKKKKSKGNCES